MAASSKTSSPNTGDPIRQFSLFAENKVGALHDFVALLAGHDIHVVAMTAIDTTDAAIVRFIVDDPDKAYELLRKHGFYFTESEVLGVEFETEADVRFLLAALLEAECNIHYLYPFLVRPGGKLAMVMHVEDNELGAHALGIRSFKVLRQRDVSR